jgi:hypothetical protein
MTTTPVTLHIDFVSDVACPSRCAASVAFNGAAAARRRWG